jgi:hypothetical protein
MDVSRSASNRSSRVAAGAGSEAVRTAYPDLFRIQNSSSPFQTTVCPAPLAEVPPPGSASSIAVVCADRFPRD